MKTSTIKLTLPLALAGLLAACSSGPRAPDWQLEAKGSMDRSVAAYMEGNSRVEMAELERARTQLTRSGRADLLATAELRHCATRVASLVFDEPCAAFHKLRPDATEAQRAYADYLKGQLQPQGIALLPEAQRAAAAGNAGALQGIADPLSKLVAAGVMLQTGKATPDVIAEAIETSSAQGWRRPLLAWLGVQLRRAEQAGDAQAAERLRRRIELTQGTSAAARPPVTKP
ncbi:MAG: hypothetical protein O9327_02770 [Polaromonas sp.]|nr:hypothetical protein [Polaromonas sp.]